MKRWPIKVVLSPEDGHPATCWTFEELVSHVENQNGLYIAGANASELQRVGVYEKTLLTAFVASPTNDWPPKYIAQLFAIADRAKLLAAGEPLPGAGPFLLFRGVAGKPPHRRVRGLSWTDSFKRAEYFARRMPDLADPAVYRLRVSAANVLTYVGGEEEEFIVQVPSTARPVRVERHA